MSALTFNGRLPGPELHVRTGELVEVTLVNRDVDEDVSIHWHGVDVPNAEDGVSGVTQDAVPPGGSYVYRFRINEPGTYWYHSHQHSAGEVERGLYGALVVTPREPQHGVDVVALAHTIGGRALLGASDREQRRRVATGTPVRLRLVNSANTVRRFALVGSAFRVVAIDAREKPGGRLLSVDTIAVPAGGRYDLAFRCPSSPVRLAVRGQDVGLGARSRPGCRPEAQFGADFDPATYGAPAAAVPAHFDRRFKVDLGRRLGFFKGGMRFGLAVDDQRQDVSAHADVHAAPRRDRRVQLLEPLAHRAPDAPPRPPHARLRARRPPHHPVVVGHARDRQRASATTSPCSPTNPGVWMFHCHNLPHAAHGLVTHVAYAGVDDAVRMGSVSGNEPE